jgi:hypothetical protein
MEALENPEMPVFYGGTGPEPSEAESEVVETTTSVRKFLPTRFPLKCLPPGALTNPIEEGGDTYIVRDTNGIDFTVRASAALVPYNATYELFAGSGPGGVFVTRKHSGWLTCMRDIKAAR